MAILLNAMGKEESALFVQWPIKNYEIVLDTFKTDICLFAKVINKCLMRISVPKYCRYPANIVLEPRAKQENHTNHKMLRNKKN